jgi:hypothetical protein
MNIRSLLLVLIVLTSGTALAADKRVPMDTGDTFVINWGADWEVGVPLPKSPPGTVTIHGPDAKLWRLTFAPLPLHPTLTGDTGNLRIYVRTLARGMENAGVRVEPDHQEIAGARSRGFYFKASDTRKKTKAQIEQAGGEYTQAWTGALSLSSRAYLFGVEWIEGGEVAAKAALAAVKTARIE